METSIKAVFSNLIKHIPGKTSQATKVLILAHRTELLQQALNAIERHNPILKVGLEEANKYADDDCDVVIASVPTIGRTAGQKLVSRLTRFDPATFKAIIVGELIPVFFHHKLEVNAHHAAASTYQRIFEHFGTDKPESDILLWGCSATVRRHDGLGLEVAFDKIVFHKSITEMIEEKWLCDMRIRSITTKVSLEGVPTRCGDFALAPLARQLNTPIQKENRKSILIFAINVEHLTTLADLLQRRGIRADALHGGTKPAQRKMLIDSFRNQELPVLVNCGIMTEGVDVPRIDCIIMARPTQSSALLQQMLGRGLRQHKDKNDCLVIDLTDMMKKPEKLVNVPVLLGLNRDFDLQGQPVSRLLELTRDRPDLKEGAKNFEQMADLSKNSAKDLKEGAKNVEEIADLSKYPAKVKVFTRDYDYPFAVASIKADNERMADFTRLAWVRTGKEECALTLPDRGTVVIEPHEGLYVVNLRSKTTKGNIRTRKKRILQHDDFEYAVRAADTWIKIEGLFSMAKRDARWRLGPATTSQISLLAKLHLTQSDYEAGLLTKGQAADLITLSLQGAKGKAREARAEEKKLAKRKALYEGFNHPLSHGFTGDF
ncbi:P-loop containing nucleoside triphosphate hydrolase protein [Phlyctochytrium arcticum]|nr:P-loop containing nucleoside triphosphate hydrolase protein [Phlyctochytrium arcticum]